MIPDRVTFVTDEERSVLAWGVIALLTLAAQTMALTSRSEVRSG